MESHTQIRSPQDEASFLAEFVSLNKLKKNNLLKKNNIYNLCVCSVCAGLCPTLCDPMTVVCQALLSMEYSSQKSWSRLPFPPPGNFPNPGIEPGSLVAPALAGGFFTTVPLGKG